MTSAKTHLENIFQKTGVKRQADSPAVPSAAFARERQQFNDPLHHGIAEAQAPKIRPDRVGIEEPGPHGRKDEDLLLRLFGHPH
jgi:hypothetical protein